MTSEAWLVVAIIVITILFLLIVLQLLRRWRFAFSDGEKILAPTYDWAKSVKSLHESMADLKATFKSISTDLQNVSEHQHKTWGTSFADTQKAQKKIYDALNAVLHETTGLHETSRILREELASQSQELERYRKGYDIEIIRRSLIPICRIHRMLTNAIDNQAFDDTARAFLDQFLEECLETLEESLVSITMPEVGSPVRTLKNIRHPPATEPTAEEDKIGTVASVQTPAYEITTSLSTTVLLPAQVSVYAPSDSTSSKPQNTDVDTAQSP